MLQFGARDAPAQVGLPIVQPQLDRLGIVLDGLVELAQFGVGFAAGSVEFGALQVEVDRERQIMNRAIRLFGGDEKHAARRIDLAVAGSCFYCLIQIGLRPDGIARRLVGFGASAQGVHVRPIGLDGFGEGRHRLFPLARLLRFEAALQSRLRFPLIRLGVVGGKRERA